MPLYNLKMNLKNGLDVWTRRWVNVQTDRHTDKQVIL